MMNGFNVVVYIVPIVFVVLFDGDGGGGGKHLMIIIIITIIIKNKFIYPRCFVSFR